jgi:hypothetical protein
MANKVKYLGNQNEVLMFLDMFPEVEVSLSAQKEYLFKIPYLGKTFGEGELLDYLAFKQRPSESLSEKEITDKFDEFYIRALLDDKAFGDVYTGEISAEIINLMEYFGFDAATTVAMFTMKAIKLAKKILSDLKSAPASVNKITRAFTKWQNILVFIVTLAAKRGTRFEERIMKTSNPDMKDAVKLLIGSLNLQDRRGDDNYAKDVLTVGRICAAFPMYYLRAFAREGRVICYGNPEKFGLPKKFLNPIGIMGVEDNEVGSWISFAVEYQFITQKGKFEQTFFNKSMTIFEQIRSNGVKFRPALKILEPQVGGFSPIDGNVGGAISMPGTVKLSTELIRNMTSQKDITITINGVTKIIGRGSAKEEVFNGNNNNP